MMFWVNGLMSDVEETLVDNELLSKQELVSLKVMMSFLNGLMKNIDEIESSISELGYEFLGRDGVESWYVLSKGGLNEL